MIKILVISDSHGLENKVDEIINSHPDVDLKIHLGDSEKSIDWLSKRFDYFVQGNCDYFYSQKRNLEEIEIEVKGVKIFMCHGHLHLKSFSSPELSLLRIANQQHCNVMLYGHLHVFSWKQIQNVFFLNPGSIKYSRSNEKESYAILRIFSKNNIECEKFLV